MSIEKVLYRAEAKATGGRDGRAVSSDNALDVKLTTPQALGGPGGEGTNPEQLFAAGYSACFLSALKLVAGKAKVALPAESSVQGQVGIGPVGAGFGLEVALTVSLPGAGSGPGGATGQQGSRSMPVLQRHSRQHRRQSERAGLIPAPEPLARTLARGFVYFHQTFIRHHRFCPGAC